MKSLKLFLFFIFAATGGQIVVADDSGYTSCAEMLQKTPCSTLSPDSPTFKGCGCFTKEQTELLNSQRERSIQQRNIRDVQSMVLRSSRQKANQVPVGGYGFGQNQSSGQDAGSENVPPRCSDKVKSAY